MLNDVKGGYVMFGFMISEIKIHTLLYAPHSALGTQHPALSTQHSAYGTSAPLSARNKAVQHPA